MCPEPSMTASKPGGASCVHEKKIDHEIHKKHESSWALFSCISWSNRFHAISCATSSHAVSANGKRHPVSSVPI